jgi:hypothetical protein
MSLAGGTWEVSGRLERTLQLHLFNSAIRSWKES